MKLSRLFFPALCFVISALFLGCARHEHGHAHDDAAHAHGEEVQGATFEPHAGLTIPENTAEFIGLKIADVAERAMRDETEFHAQIYSRTKDDEARAAGFVSPGQAKMLRPGMTGQARPPGSKEGAREAAITDIRAHSTNGPVEVILTVKSPDLSIADSLLVSIPMGEAQKALAIPKAALLKTVEGHFVYTASGDHFVRTGVKIGRGDETHVAITDGLYEGDRVALEPVMTLWLTELQSIRGGKACADGH